VCSSLLQLPALQQICSSCKCEVLCDVLLLQFELAGHARYSGFGCTVCSTAASSSSMPAHNTNNISYLTTPANLSRSTAHL
jgi:hypothetical protein